MSTATIRVGGPPAGARTISRVTVLRGTSAADWCPTLPGVSSRLGTQLDGDGLVRRVRPHTLWVNRAGRNALADYLEARGEDRVIDLHEVGGQHFARVYDGRGRMVDDLAGGPTDEETARVLARAEWWRLREDAAAEPWRWVIA